MNFDEPEIQAPADNCGCTKGDGMVGKYGWHWIVPSPGAAPMTWIAWERCPAYVAAVRRNGRAA